MQHTRQIAVPQGSIHVTSDPQVVFYTPLGSCISACMFDPVSGVGGMNHFLLPASPGNDNHSSPAMFGIHAMPMLLDAMMDAGASPGRIRARLFGGIRNVFGGRDIGMLNRDIAAAFLVEHGILNLGGVTCTDDAVSVSFRAATGQISGRRFERTRRMELEECRARM
ncbi:chemotaxis protein CheD [Agrobacterium rubi]|nr:chemotaxis protein CheD [Agrobacterium rubi]NTF24384.1 chemotaxis protein CheD [Agrobacterium rubi]